MKCSVCGKEEARSYFKKKRVCEKCFYELKGKLFKKKEHICSICGKTYLNYYDPHTIPYCSTKCQSKGIARFKKSLQSNSDNYK